jgi:hypothetical protein
MSYVPVIKSVALPAVLSQRERTSTLLVLQKPCINTINSGATFSVYLSELGGSHGGQVGRLFFTF